MTNEDGTIYVVHWTHTPENCPGRTKEGAEMLDGFWANRDEAEKRGIKILSAYVGVTSHEYYITVQTNDYAGMVEFFLPLVPTQTGKVTPVMTMDRWIDINRH